MKINCYLLIAHNGSVSVRKSGPRRGAITPGTVVLPLRIDIPDSAFANYLRSIEIGVPETPQFEATVDLVTVQEDQS